MVTVALNAGSDLRATTESVSAQQGLSVQHVIKDGVSKDGSTEFLKHGALGAELLAVPDDGVYDAMNQAVERARCEYVHFLNCGDRYTSECALQRVAKAARAAGSPDLVVTWYRNLEHDAIRTCPETLSPWYLFRAAIGHQAVYFRRDLLQRVGRYDTDYRLLADHDLIFRALLKNRASYLVLPEVIVDYKGEGLTADPANQRLKAAEAARVRATHFHGPKGLLFRILHEATLWRLRTRLLRFPAFRRIYYAAVAALNR